VPPCNSTQARTDARPILTETEATRPFWQAVVGDRHHRHSDEVAIAEAVSRPIAMVWISNDCAWFEQLLAAFADVAADCG